MAVNTDTSILEPPIEPEVIEKTVLCRPCNKRIKTSEYQAHKRTHASAEPASTSDQPSIETDDRLTRARHALDHETTEGANELSDLQTKIENGETHEQQFEGKRAQLAKAKVCYEINKNVGESKTLDDFQLMSDDDLDREYQRLSRKESEKVNKALPLVDTTISHVYMQFVGTAATALGIALGRDMNGIDDALHLREPQITAALRECMLANPGMVKLASWQAQLAMSTVLPIAQTLANAPKVDRPKFMSSAVLRAPAPIPTAASVTASQQEEALPPPQPTNSMGSW